MNYSRINPMLEALASRLSDAASVYEQTAAVGKASKVPVGTVWTVQTYDYVEDSFPVVMKKVKDNKWMVGEQPMTHSQVDKLVAGYEAEGAKIVQTFKKQNPVVSRLPKQMTKKPKSPEDDSMSGMEGW